MGDPIMQQLAADAIIPELGVSLLDLETYVVRAREGQYLLVAGITLIVYDYFCTLVDEIDFVWSRAPRLVPAKILFAVNRYLPIFTLTIRFYVLNKAIYNASVSTFILPCNFALMSASGFGAVINVAMVEVVFLLRVWVLYAKKKWIGIALWSFYAVCLGSALAVKYLQPHVNLPFVRAPTYGNTACTKVVPGELFFLYGVVTIIESVFFTMLLVKAYKTTRNSSHTPILTALLKQGTFYYFIVLAILAVTMFAPFSDTLYWAISNAFPIVPIVSIACNRLILSLRGMVFSQSVVRASGFGMSADNEQAHSGTGSSPGNFPPNAKARLPASPIQYSHGSREINPIDSSRKRPALVNNTRSSVVVTFTEDWREESSQNYQLHSLDNSLAPLDVSPGSPRFEQRQQQQRGGGGEMEESWSAMEQGDKNLPVYPMIPVQRA